MEVAFAPLAALINLLAIALYHERNRDRLLRSFVMHFWRRRRERLKRMTEPGPH